MTNLTRSGFKLIEFNSYEIEFGLGLMKMLNLAPNPRQRKSRLIPRPSLVMPKGHHPSQISYRECSLGFEKKSFLADCDLMIESGLADSTSGSIDILKLIPPPKEVVHSEVRLEKIRLISYLIRRSEK